MVKVSIIIPVYNVAQYVLRCLESVSNQTYQGEIECIIVDDCGPDNSAEICEKYIKNYKGDVKYYLLHRLENGGLSAARNIGTMNASGDYLYFLDSDDEIPKNAIELLVREVDKHPGVDIVMGFMYDDKQSDYYDISLYRDHQYVKDNEWIQYNSFNCHKVIPVNGCNKLLRKAFILDNDLFFKPGIIHEDEHWMFFVTKVVKDIAFVFEPTYIRYWNDGSIMTSTSKEKEAINWHKILFDFVNNLDNPFFELKTLRCMSYYFRMNLYAFNMPYDCQLRWKFARACFKSNMWKGGVLMVLYNSFFWFRRGWRMNRVLYNYSTSIFEKKSSFYYREKYKSANEVS